MINKSLAYKVYIEISTVTMFVVAERRGAKLMLTNWSTEYQIIIEKNDANTVRKGRSRKVHYKNLVFVKQLTVCVCTCVKIYDYRESSGRKNSYLHWLQREVGVSIKKLNKSQSFKSFHELKKQACVLLTHLSKSTAVSNACINEKGWSLKT